jgi:hypothetical protein
MAVVRPLAFDKPVRRRPTSTACGNLLKTMIFSVDHIVFAASNQQTRTLVARLVSAGFDSRGFELDFPEIGAGSESLGYAGGGMVEFVYQRGRNEGASMWFDRVPRVIGVGLASNDFEADTSWHEADAWTMSEDHRLPDGSIVNIHAAGPHQHMSPFYVFVMDRSEGRLQFPDLRSGPTLRHIDISGRDAELWRDRLHRWLRLDGHARHIAVGDAEIRFRASSGARLQVSLTFEVGRAAARLPLSDGAIDLVVAS